MQDDIPVIVKTVIDALPTVPQSDQISPVTRHTPPNSPPQMVMELRSVSQQLASAAPPVEVPPLLMPSKHGLLVLTPIMMTVVALSQPWSQE